LINIYRTPVSGVLRRKDSGFAVCGENLASVSQFVAGIRHGRSSCDIYLRLNFTGTFTCYSPHDAKQKWLRKPGDNIRSWQA
jgi:hypothetical protein